MFGDKVKELRLSIDKSQSEVARDLNISRSTVGMIEKGERMPSPDLIMKFANYFNVTIDYFFGRDYKTTENLLRMQKLKKLKYELEDNSCQVAKEQQKYETLDSTLFKIPCIGFVPAGGPVLTEENLDGYIDLPLSMIKSSDDFCLKIRGNSMEDVGINDGDTVLVHPQPTAENGQTVIARIDGGVTCKRFYKTNGKCTLEPANHNYKPMDCKEIEIVGIVTKIIKDVF